MIKAILFSLDCILKTEKPRAFMKRFATEYNISITKIKPFFDQEFKDAVVGLTDMKDALSEYLKYWNWDGNVDDFLAYWFSGIGEEDHDLVQYIQKLRSFGIECHLVANADKYQAEYLLDEAGLASLFDEAFFSSDLHFTKNNPKFFEKISQILAIDDDEILYFNNKNIKSIKKETKLLLTN